MNTIRTYKEIENVNIGRMFYKYKNIRMYQNVKDNGITQSYWFSVLLLDKDNYSYPYKGKLIPHIDIRTLPGFDKEKHNGFQLITSPQTVVPKLYRAAMKAGLIEENMFVYWNVEDSKYMIDEI